MNVPKKSMFNISGHLWYSYSKTQMKEHLTFHNREVEGEERYFMTEDFISSENEYNPD